MKTKKLKIAVSSTGKGLNARVDFRFGRAPFFVIVEIENKKIKTHKTILNPNALKGQGAGIATAQLIANEGVDVVITSGGLGPNAFRVLRQLKILVYKYKGVQDVKSVIQKYLDGKLEKIAKAGPAYKGFGISRVRERL